MWFRRFRRFRDHVLHAPVLRLADGYPPSSGSIGAPTTLPAFSVSGYAGDVLVPTGVTVLADNSAVYVSAYDQSAYNPGCTTSSTANPGWIFGFTVGSDGSLTATKNSPYEAGIKPSALAADPTDRFVYVTDYASNQLIGYTILDGSTLSFLPTAPSRPATSPQRSPSIRAAGSST